MMSCLSPLTVPGPRCSGTTGQIQVVFGPMFSGKTTELMRRMKRYQIANYKCMIIKYANDTRYDKTSLATHDKQTLAATSAVTLLPMVGEALEYDVIGVDEGQFFPDVVTFCEQMADRGKTVIVAALDGTYQRKGFGNILELVPLAESVVKLTAVCMQCYGEASFTKRKGAETAVEVIGGADKYLATCRACYREPGKTSPACSPSRRSAMSFNRSPAKGTDKSSRRLFGNILESNTMETS